MIPMLPVCDPCAMPRCCNRGMMGVSPVMMPMMPVGNTPFCCPANNFNMISTTMMSEYDSRMYGRFRHVQRENPSYRHAPFDWYRPPKQYYNIVHEDAAVVTLDGPVPIGDFYRHYIYGDLTDDYDDDDYDDSISLASEEYDDVGGSSYEPRSTGYRRYPRSDPDFDDDDIDIPPPPTNRSLRGRGNYSTLNPNRRRTNPSGTPGTRTLAGDDDFDDADSVNSTYGN